MGTMEEYKMKRKVTLGRFGQIMGIGKYNKTDNTKLYDVWTKILERCYSEDRDRKTYDGCSVCEEWFNFQNFAKWYEDNIWNEECKFIDKDILIKGNKVYSPETCVLVDNRVNCLFTKRQNCRNNSPIGVTYREKYNKKYLAQCHAYGTMKNIGTYNNPTDAFNAYKVFKEKYIKEVADEYKYKYPNFPINLYNAMYDYEVEITD